MVVFIFLVVQGLHKGRRRWHRLVTSAVYQRERAPDPDYYRCDDCLFLVPRFRCGDHAFGKTPDAARVIQKAIFLTAVYGGVNLYRGVVLYTAVLSRKSSRFKDPDARTA